MSYHRSVSWDALQAVCDAIAADGRERPDVGIESHDSTRNLHLYLDHEPDVRLVARMTLVLAQQSDADQPDWLADGTWDSEQGRLTWQGVQVYGQPGSGGVPDRENGTAAR